MGKMKKGFVTGADKQQVWTHMGSTVWFRWRGKWLPAKIVSMGRVNVEVETEDGKKHYLNPVGLIHRNIAVAGRDKPTDESPNKCKGCGYTIAHGISYCGECMCEDDCAP